MNINIYPNPHDLRYFQEIALTGNISRASERLGIGQPALSLSLKRLEDGLGVKLFVRTNRGLNLSTAGQRLLKEVNQLQSIWESVISETKKSETEIIGKFTLGCHPSVALYLFKDIFRDIYSSHAGLEIQLIHNLSRVICEGVISGVIDFGIVVNPIRHPDLVITEILKDEFGFWRAPNGLKDVLIYNPLFTQSQNLIKKFKKQKFSRNIITESLEVSAILAKSGAGTALLPERVAKILCPELKRVEGSPVFQDQITFIYRTDLRKTAGAKAIIQKLKNIKD